MKFGDLFDTINVPILICEDGKLFTLVYGNGSAAGLLNPLRKAKWGELMQDYSPLYRYLNMPMEDFRLLTQLVNQKREGCELHTSIRLPQGEALPVVLLANKLELGSKRYIKLCVYPQYEKVAKLSHSQILSTILRAGVEAGGFVHGIEGMLSQLGQALGLCRVYLFEAVSSTIISNSFEWCLPERTRRLDSQRQLPKQQLYQYIMGDDAVTGEDSQVFLGENEVVVGSSETRSILSVPILSGKSPLGHLVLEDSIPCRNWAKDLPLLQDVIGILRFFLIHRDEEKRQGAELAVLNTVIGHFDDIIYVTDLESKEILFANRALSEAISIPLQELKGCSSVEIMERFGREPRALPGQLSTEEDGSIRTQKYTWEFHNRFNNRWYLVRSATLQWIDGEAVQLEILTDITEHKEHENMLEYIASTDMMTGVYNREWGRRLIEYLLDNTDSEQRSCLVFLDLDNLKYVNDHFGHGVGDQMIKSTVAIIQSCIRKTDFLCRWGGDEFLIIVRAREEDTLRLMHKIQHRLDEYNASGRSLFQLSFSYGVVEINLNTTHTIESLISEADQRMYSNKLKRLQKCHDAT